ncbi:uncharacterized protein DUF1659 [Caldicellulosiruptor bescii]|jgi:hypothetical protein|uniref:DUF1659 domain-containing protein n=4 Tax=Caldicellulosiruptor TaxID=44000 RepID=B9MQC6_CALBD|nr:MULTISPECIES: DUF1659 domain-containing protein [Caldicellulosiruptor]ACM61783.1 protein of unknown function DUF1659 [Caldicellulosiruptor bescii DSM 6725]ADQ08275.1 protein of unknown function DUF1659 [Caldicellulosiruptor hydrothermalis 108]ADQ47350.1 protein of unknown function DUF1659 [Caldicellulosiruptor kronotskyensis 2002]PBC88418.1 uncharacterized protein DUF1659 [Caldicellulosiruptor bescii]PBC92101.1 uncharacterized protein DUF1659 [Caldicellulosiruptor bescii]
MAAKPLVGSLQLKLENGTTSTGKIRLKTLSFDIKPEAQDMDVYQVGQAIASLQSKPLYTIIRSNNFELLY